MPCRAVKILHKPIAQIFVREVSDAGQDTLFQFPGVYRACPQHVAAMIGLDDYRVAAAELFADEIGDMSKIHESCDLAPGVLCDKAKIVDRIVGNAEGFEIDIADRKFITRFDLDGPLVE